MYPNRKQKQQLQYKFDKLNEKFKRPTYKLCDRALEAAHRVSFTSDHDSDYTCSLCSNTKSYKTEKQKRWELFNHFNMSTPSPAPKVLQRLNPVERQMIARSAVVMTIHNRLHDTNRKQSRSTGHGCIIQMDAALQMQSIRHKLPRHRNDINIWQVVREDAENKPYRVAINIEHVLEALDWQIEHNVLYQDLKNTDWRNEAAINDYTHNTSFTIQQHTAKKTKRDPPVWRKSDVTDCAENIELGRSQPGLDENENNIPALTPSHDVTEGEYVQYDENAQCTCPYSQPSTVCLSPDTCLCRQVLKAVPSGLDKTTTERWSSIIGEDEVMEARQAASEIIERQRKSPVPKQPKTCDIRFDYVKARPQNEWSEKDIIAMAFVVEFPFGITGFRTLRHTPIDDIIEWTRHLCYLCYQINVKTGELKHTFQANPVFVLYIRNRAHRHAINNGLKFFLQRTTKQLKRKFPLWKEGITNAEFKKWPKAELLKFHEFVTSNMECKPGDPADLRNFKKTITSCTLAHGTPTDYITTSWDDPNVWDLHRPQILPYKEILTPGISTPRKQNIGPIDDINEKEMKSKAPETIERQQTSTQDNSPKIFEKPQRYTMLHENPATVCMWFFIRQFVNMQVMRECSYPVAYEKWFARKFEFQDRGSVHEHAVKALTFLWIKADAEGKQKKAEELTEADFEEITCRTDKLSMYCELGMVRQIMIGRILNRIKKYMKPAADIPSSVEKKLTKLKNLFQEKNDWFKCSCEAPCSHKCANQELREMTLVVAGVPKPELKEPETLEISNDSTTKQNTNECAEDDEEFGKDAFASFNHISVTYEDPTLKELCSWVTDDLNETSELTKMFESYREWILLGRHAEKMLTAFVDARMHCWDNTQVNHPGRTANSGIYKHGRVDTANRITRLRHAREELPCDPTLYEDRHRMHVQTSQLHECNKCCLRYKKIPKKSNSKSDQQLTTDAPTLIDQLSNSVTKVKDKLTNLVRVCRFRSPWLERMCKKCHKKNNNLRFDICKKCREEDHIPTTTNSQHVPYRPQLKTEITYSVRFDRENRFHSARPEINVRRNNPWDTTHNRDATLVNAGNTDLQITFHIGRILSYLYSYLAKKEVTKGHIQRHLNASLRALSDVLKSSYVVTLQRAVSAAIAGRTFSTQAAWWQILGLPICDTNIKRDCIFINSRSRRLNIAQLTSNDKSKTRLVKRDFFDAYAQRMHNATKHNRIDPKEVNEYCLEEFVEECYHQAEKGALIIGRRVQRHKCYSRIDPVLKYADHKYPFVHMVQFPELFDKKLDNGNPKGKHFWKWCQLQLTIHKLWQDTPLNLWGKRDQYKSIDDVPKKVFIEK